MTAEALKKHRQPLSKRDRIMMIVLAVIMMGLFRTGFLLIVIGLMPAIVTYYMDYSRRRYVFKTIFACNLAGMMPAIITMLANGPRSMVMQEIMGDASNWIMIYGFAFMGWLMVKIAPLVALSLISGFHGTQILRLKGNQRRIENEWGKEVTQFSKKPDEDEDDFWTV